MLKIAKAFETAGDGGTQLARGFKLFDSEGVELLQFLKLGEIRLRKVFDEAKRLGIVFSQLEIRQIENATSAVDKLRAMFEGGKGRAAIGLAPLVQAVSEAFQDMGAIGAASGQRITGFFGGVGEVLAVVLGLINKITVAWAGMNVVVDTGVAALFDLFRTIADPRIQGTPLATASLDEAVRRFNETLAKARAFGDITQRMQEIINRARANAGLAGEPSGGRGGPPGAKTGGSVGFRRAAAFRGVSGSVTSPLDKTRNDLLQDIKDLLKLNKPRLGMRP